MSIEAVSASKSSISFEKDVRTDAHKVEQATEPQAVAQNYADKSFVEAKQEEKLPGNPPSEHTIKQAISDINKKINPNTIAEYGYHEETNRVTIKIVDKDTQKTVKEYPAEETLDMIAKVWELAGMFVDQKS